MEDREHSGTQDTMRLDRLLLQPNHFALYWNGESVIMRRRAMRGFHLVVCALALSCLLAGCASYLQLAQVAPYAKDSFKFAQGGVQGHDCRSEKV